MSPMKASRVSRSVAGEDYPLMQALSVQEMLTNYERPNLPPVDLRWLVGDTQMRMAVT